MIEMSGKLVFALISLPYFLIAIFGLAYFTGRIVAYWARYEKYDATINMALFVYTAFLLAGVLGLTWLGFDFFWNLLN